MKNWIALCGLSVVAIGTLADAQSNTPDPQTALVKQYCAGCHSERGKSGGLSLAAFEVEKAPQHADVAERMIRKLRAGMMPPPGARRPDEAALPPTRDDGCSSD
jgi:hypothetical protein